MKKVWSLLLSVVFVLVLAPTAWAAKYVINDESTHYLLDKNNTNAVIDNTGKGHIRLPRGNPSGITFLGEDSFDVAVITAKGIEVISPTGDTKTIVDIQNLSNPAAVFAGGIYPDVIIVEDDKNDNGKSQITHFSNLGSEYAENPSLLIQGLDKTVSVASFGLNRATLTESGDFFYHYWLGNEYHTRKEAAGLSNPINMALLGEGYDAVVLDESGVKRITSMSSVSSLLSGSYVALAGHTDSFAVINKNVAEHYHIIGNEVHKNDWLTVKEGLDSPSAIALRPGSYDRAIVDGNIIKFYFWTGEELTLAGEVEFDVLDGIGKYINKARAVSSVISKEDKDGNELEITHVRITNGGIDSYNSVTNSTVASTSTWVEWYVTTHPDLIKDDIQKADLNDLTKWTRVTAGDWYILNEPSKKVRWMAVLRTKDGKITPRIHEFIEIEFRVNLKPPELNLPANGVFYTSNPEIWWTFDDSGIDSTQSAFQLVLFKNGSEEIFNTGKVISGQNSYVIRNTNNHASLWGEGTDTFQVQVKVWDNYGSESPFTSKKTFRILAFDRPVITEIISPPMRGREWINRHTESMQLPISKAGTAITMRIHGIGVNDLSKADIYYPGSRTLDKDNNWVIKTSLVPEELRDRVEYIEDFKLVEENGINKAWEATFYTAADGDITPNGTVIAGKFYASNFSSSEPLLIMDDIYDYKDRKKPSDGDEWTTWIGYRWWSEGISIVNDNVLSDWIVVLKAKDKGVVP